MKMKLLRQLIVMSKYTFYSLIIQVFLCSFLIAKEGKAQRESLEDIYVSLNFEDYRLNKVFSKIEAETNFNFAYHKNIFAVKHKVTANFNNQSLANVLRYISKETGLKFKRVNENIQVQRNYGSLELVEEEFANHPAQDVVISGKVIEKENGEALPGVSILVKGTTNGTITDMNGDYKLSVPANAVLQYSFIGFKSIEMPLGSQTVINIELEQDVDQLEEVVVLGYSSKDVSKLTASVSVVKEEELKKGVTTSSLGAMLQGKVAGVQVTNTTGRPGQNPQIVIRGVGSLGAGIAPLYVVDGVIGGYYNPQDIESISILKDAAATGLYGSRAANGVVVITTKSGGSGKTTVHVSSTFGPSYQQDGKFDPMNAQELYDFQRTAATNSYNKLDNPSQSLDEYLNERVPDSYLENTGDWQNMLSRTGFVQQHQVSVSGGNDKTKFYISGNYFDEKGTMINMDYKRVDFRANIEHEISKVFNLGVRSVISNNWHPNEPQGGQEGLYAQYLISMPYDAPYDMAGNPVNPYDPEVLWHGNAKSNYFYSRDHYEDKTQARNIATDLELTANIAEGLTFKTTNRFSFYNDERAQLFDKYHFLGESQNGLVNNWNTNGNSFLTSNKLVYDQDFGNHGLNVILGQEYNYSKNKSLYASGMDIPVGLSALNSTGTPNAVGGNSTEAGFKSYFAQVDYSFKDKYFVVLSNRFDASSKFGANNRWGNFYALGGSWILSNEEFLQGNNWIDKLKLRASYGTTGNANIQNYLSLSSYSFSSSYNGNSAAVPARLANPDLTWEVAKTTNLGIDFSTLKNRLRIEFDWYNRINEDLLQSVPLSAATGFSSQEKNIGSVRNRGIDLNINTVNLQGEFSWLMNFNVNINKSKILSLNDDEDISNGINRYVVGEPLRSWYIREWAGVNPETGQPMWVRWEDEDGNMIHQEGGANANSPANVTTTDSYNQASLQILGTPYPDFYGGWSNDFMYKNFSLSILANYSYGGQIYTSLRERMDSDGAFLAHNKINPIDGWTRWEKPGDIATHPELLYNGNNNSFNTSSRYIEDASYFRIQNISFAYTPNLKLGPVSNLRFKVNVDNVATFTKFSGSDPSANSENPTSGQDANTGLYAPTRKILFGVEFDL
ncbi:TonB-dependent receptor [Flexithrix dorotheae]|uniref:TonB-dependent receptor n=1 Tax=Flexithrix dorotheae TaxID=70993 RepID=UPI0003A1117A|nr:TonB-dependent receptor [Flexithrix dorotheae]